MSVKKDSSKQKEYIKDAQYAANSGNALSMLEFLFASTLLEAYQRSFSQRYSHIDNEDIYDVIANATDELFQKIIEKKQVRAIESYLWKIIDNKLSNFSASREIFSGHDVDQIGRIDGSKTSFVEREKVEEQREKALTIAESLIPRLGLVNAQNVMRYILGAIRNGAQDVTSKEIGDALGLTSTNVRQSMKRGFERLAAIVKEENLVSKSYNFKFLEELDYYIDSEEEDSEEHEIIE